MPPPLLEQQLHAPVQLPLSCLLGITGSFIGEVVSRCFDRLVHEAFYGVDEVLHVLHIIGLVRRNRYPALIERLDLHLAIERGAFATKGVRLLPFGLRPFAYLPLGVTSIRLLTTSRPMTYVGLSGFGIEIAGTELVEG